jgi:hypothetical protein
VTNANRRSGKLIASKRSAFSVVVLLAALAGVLALVALRIYDSRRESKRVSFSSMILKRVESVG